MTHLETARSRHQRWLTSVTLCSLLAAGCITGKAPNTDNGVVLDNSLTDGEPPPAEQGKKDGPKKDGSKKDGPPPRPDAGGELSRPGWALIRPGSFFMGSPAKEHCHKVNETRHKVTLTHEIEIMQAEVTQQQFKDRLGANPTHPKDKNCGMGCPVTAVSWNGAAAYCNELSRAMKLEQCYSCTGSIQASLQCGPATMFHSPGNPIYNCKGFRLPTEAEWEYAYRAGSQTAYYNGDDALASACFDCSSTGIRAYSIGWYCTNAGSKLHAGKLKGQNPWLLYDMPGNASEWVDDWYHQDLGAAAVVDPWKDLAAKAKEKVLRGGSWPTAPDHLRAARRNSFEPSSTSTLYRYNGFRCVRTLK